MDILKKLFPFAFAVGSKNTGALVKSILIHLAISLVWAVISGILGAILGNLIGWLLGIVGSVVGLYTTAGIVLAILLYVGVIKK